MGPVNHLILGVLLVGLVSAPLTLGAQVPTESAASFLERARGALDRENYQEALRILEEGKKVHPEEASLRGFLGDLYTEKGVYPLALEEYREALKREPDNWNYNYMTAETLGLLNRNAESIQAFEDARVLFPEDARIVQALAWMYFKVEDFPKGVLLIESARETLGGNRSFSMTLGTLYSSLYEYEKSREAYQDSIRRALREGDQEFASIAYYNLSILETNFLKFDQAFQSVEESLDLVERPPGHLALGELLQSQMNFKRALETFEQAEQGETTPLTKMDLAKLYRQFGFLDTAAAYLKRVESSQDDSWMYNFGVTKGKWDQEIQQTWGEIYRGLAAEGDFQPRFWPWEWVTWLWDKIRFSLLAWFHEQKARDLQLSLAGESLGRSNNPQGWWSLYKATDRYPWASRKYLKLAREFEESRIPGVEPLYVLEEGKLENQPVLLAQALETLDPQWFGLERTEAILALLPSQPEDQRRILLNQLYALNPGALRQAGWTLPVQVNLYGPDAQEVETWSRDLEWWAWTSGHDVKLSGDPGREYQLDLHLTGDGTVRYALRNKDGRAVFQDYSPADKSGEFFNEIFTKIHRVN